MDCGANERFKRSKFIQFLKSVLKDTSRDQFGGVLVQVPETMLDSLFGVVEFDSHKRARVVWSYERPWKEVAYNDSDSD